MSQVAPLQKREKKPREIKPKKQKSQTALCTTREIWQRFGGSWAFVRKVVTTRNRLFRKAIIVIPGSDNAKRCAILIDPVEWEAALELCRFTNVFPREDRHTEK